MSWRSRVLSLYAESVHARGGIAYSAEKFARWRILVTAAESWRWEDEEAARRVPLGREMDMADVDFRGGRPCNAMYGRKEETPPTAHDSFRRWRPPRRVHKRPCVITFQPRHSPRSANTESPMTGGPSSLDRDRSDAGK